MHVYFTGKWNEMISLYEVLHLVNFMAWERFTGFWQSKARFPLPELTGDRFPLPVNSGRDDGWAFPLHKLTARQHGPS